MSSHIVFHGRVCFRRRLGQELYFIDVIHINHENPSNPWGVELIELCISGYVDGVPSGPESFEKERLEAIHVGDVLRIEGVVEVDSVAQPPRQKIVKVSSFEIVESWNEAFHHVSTKKPKSYAYHLPSFLEKWSKTEELPAAIGRGKPVCILQCHLPLAERIANLFDGIIAVNLTKDRSNKLFVLLNVIQFDPPILNHLHFGLI